ncbi:KRI1-like family-domain-containing protein [Coniella lustricola]|uniref:KRI1-like family-domain-containing protein n=1 Tax=Coniella lustricola TaxID=2025994 RepID=A0A2T2ZT64_9PEZI|nr:KRI1-like family-domain-containing protein [Coniella lustricola]
MAKKSLFDDEGASSGGEDAQPRGLSLKVNEEYARRFEHNKKRAEMHRLEEKYKANPGDDDESSSDDETEDEEGFLATEELDAEISATLQAIKNKDPRIYDKDAKFFHSIDENGNAVAGAGPKEKKTKPMFLRDYHRERYMAGDTGADEQQHANDAQPRTFVQEQAELKDNILAEINAAVDGSDGEDGEEAFIKAKPGAKPLVAVAEAAAAAAAAPTTTEEGSIHPSRLERMKPKPEPKGKGRAIKELDPSLADKDPELYLSNFMASRAWAEGSGNKWQAFESDDGEDNDDADEWEAAYNLRFEDPAKSNEVLMSYSRKVVEARTVRREELTGRKRQRELEKERKAEEKRLRHEERARLKRLKVEEAEQKLKKIRKAAGLKGRELKDDEWMELLEGAWENDKWEEEMSRRFGDEYYADADAGSAAEEEESGGDDDNDNEAGADGAAAKKKKKNKKPKKPTWDDDIDIKDIIPDFEDEETSKPAISLSDLDDDDDNDDEQEKGAQGAAIETVEDEDAAQDSDNNDQDAASRPSKKRKTTKDIKAERAAAKRASRQERAKIEALVDAQMELDDPTVLATSRKNTTSKPAAGTSARSVSAPSSSTPASTAAKAAPFRYRETSPQSFGLTPRDILLAPSDAALNDFAGLKKLATWRDADKKKKDKKKLGKKARLRAWRRDVFGQEFEHSGPTFGFSGPSRGQAEQEGHGHDHGQVDEVVRGDQSGENNKKKRKRSKAKKAAA